MDTRHGPTVAASVSWTVPDLVEIAPSGDGLGVYARRAIAAGTVIGIFQGRIERFQLIDGQPAYGDANIHLMLDLHVDGNHLYALTLPDTDCPINRVNHSCQPNCELVGAHGLTLVASQEIAAGEELTFDYRPVTLIPIGISCWCDRRPRCIL